MRIIFLICLCSCLSIAAFCQTASLTVVVKGISSKKGNVLIGLFNKAEGYGERSHIIAGGRISADTTFHVFTFNKLPAGDYALTSYHDENADDKINTNMVGYPKERYGFSNNIYGPFGTIPDFEKAKITLTEGAHKEITILLK